MTQEEAEEQPEETEEKTQPTQEPDTKKSGRSNRSEKQKAALAAARAKAVEARKLKAEMRRKQAESKTDDIVEDTTNEPIVNNNVNDAETNEENTEIDRYVTEKQLNNLLSQHNVRLQTNRKSKYMYVDGVYVKTI